MEEVEAEVEEACGDGLAVELEVALLEVPASRPHEQGRHLLVQPVGLVGGLELDRAVDRVAEVRLALEHVPPGRRVRVLEVGHEHARARVERVDDHLPVGRPGDLDAPVEQVRRNRIDHPVGLAEIARFGQEVRQLSGRQSTLPLGASKQ
jgi:hypothetical protein